MKLELGKTYKMSNGFKCRVICTDRKQTMNGAPVPVVALLSPDEQLIVLTEEGVWVGYNVHVTEEYDPWTDIPIDTPIWVQDTSGNGSWLKRHFAEIKDGSVWFWHGGTTSFSTEEPSIRATYGASLTDPYLDPAKRSPA